MDIRKEFLEFFKSKGHEIVESSYLVPDDPTLLFVNAGMVQFKPVFVGEVPFPNPPRATSSQACIRAGGKHNDLDNVGYTARHHTFFEMLGNFSFGDYFKEDAIKYAWEFITQTVKLPKDKLWVSVHDSDDEAEEIWCKYLPKERIKRMGDKDNFWQMGDTGPCGPCSEIYYDQGGEIFNTSEDYFGGDGDRFLEIWNLVFMQYNRDESGTLNLLPKPSIDTGMGLERITAIKEGVTSNYSSTLFMPIINEISKLTNQEYIYAKGASFRVIADHIRSVTFLLAQGVNFDKEGRGYVLRRILRRGVRHGYLLGLKEPFMHKLVDTLCSIMGESYPYIIEKKEGVKELIKLEEERFYSTIAKGMELFEEELVKGEKIFSGEVAFKLYDTYGFPLDLTEDMLRDKNIALDHGAFNICMTEQKQRAKAAWKGSGDAIKDGDFKELLSKFGKNSFVGYKTVKTKAKILALLDVNLKHTELLKANQTGWIMLDNTPFYATSGGQVGDSGNIIGYAKVIETEKFFDLNLSKVEVAKDLVVGLDVDVEVDIERKEIARHHSSAHLLHSALGIILGSNATQAGSLVEKDRVRFDFNYPKQLSSEQLDDIEEWVNERIREGLSGVTQELAIEDAKKCGAKALFGEKYGDIVRVVSFSDVSVELCGGTHVENVAEIGSFFITKESGVSAGVRRIEAVCSNAAYRYAKDIRSLNKEALSLVRANDLLVGIKKSNQTIKDLKNEIDKLQSSSSKEINSFIHNDVKVVVDKLEAGDLKKCVDDLKNSAQKVVVLLFQIEDGKIKMAAGSKDCGVHSGNLIKEISSILGGKGGGRADFASGGGSDISKLDEAMSRSIEFIKANI